MPTYRQLHLKILDSEDFNEMPDDFTRVVWLLLPLIVDSEGRGIGKTPWIRSKMFPLRDDVTLTQLDESLQWLKKRGMIAFYLVGDSFYFHITKFKTYQTGTNREGKSYIPAPPVTFQSMSVVTPELLQSNSNDAVLYCIESELNCIESEEKKLFSTRDAEKALVEVTSLYPLPSTYNVAILDRVLDMIQHYGRDETVNKLKIAWGEWGSKKRKDNGLPYSKTNPAWIDNAIVAPDPEPIAEEMTPEEREEWNRRVNAAIIPVGPDGRTIGKTDYQGGRE